MKNFYFTLLFSLAGLFGFGQSTEVGITEGELSVSLSGAATYTIPIAVPPGINGIEPQISLNYNSQRGLNGTAAIGWDIAGVSSITRIPSTKFHDGVIDPVDFDALDRFALDGQRLIVKNGTSLAYGADRTVYETESFSNLKITSYGVHPNGANYGPAYFIVEYPDGSKAYYGNSTDSLSVAEWSITYWENAQGVRISYNYTLSNNTLYIASVKYGSLTTAAPKNEIQFTYGSRSFKENGYVGGVNIIRDKNLTSIKTIGNGLGYRNYILNAPNELISVTEKSGDNSKSYNPTVFNYGLNGVTDVKYLPINTSLDVGKINSLNAATISGDFNNDGSTDFLLYPTTGPQAKKVFWLYYDIQSGSNQNMGYPFEVGAFDDIFPTTWLSWNNKVMSQGWTVVQTDAITKSTKFRPFSYCDETIICRQDTKEYVFPKFTRQYFYSCNGGGGADPLRVGTNKMTDLDLMTSASTLKEGYVEKDVPKNYISGDFNGDGLTDVIAIEKSISYAIYNGCVTTIPQTSAGGKSYFINLDRRLTTDFVNQSGYLSVTDNSKFYVGDFDGDGKSDLYIFDLYYVKIYSLDANNNLVLLYQNTTADPAIVLDKPILIGDYNGDGKSDFMIPKALGTSTWYKYTSTGISQIKEEKSSSVFFSSNDSYNTYNFLPANINNDGKTDLIQVTSFRNPANTTGIITVACFTNEDGDFKSDPRRASTGDQEGIDIYALPMYLPQTKFVSNTGVNQTLSTLEIAFVNKNKMYFFNSKYNVVENNLLNKVTTGNDVQEMISYTSLEHKYNDLYYPIFTSSTGISNYPDFDITIDPNFYVVSKLEKRSEDASKKRLFSYYGAVSNLEGLGFMGFRSISQTNWYEDDSKIITNILKFDIDQRGVNTENYNVLGFHEPLYASANPISRIITKGENYTVTDSDNLVATQGIILKPGVVIKSGSTFSAKINPDANRSSNTPADFITRSALTYESELLANKVFKFKNTVVNQYNNLNGTSDETVNAYDENNNITSSRTLSKEGSTVVQTATTDIAYQSPISSPYILGRPASKNQTVSVNGHTMTNQELYTYNSNQLLSKVDKSASGTATISEENNYDSYGNITKKTITAPFPLQPRITDYEYDPSGRFVTKITDTERLSTIFVYNPDGTLKSETSPYGLTTSYTYDAWFKNLTIKDDQLNKVITSNYARNGKKTIITTTVSGAGLDTSVSEDTFDDLGRKIKSGVKDLNGNFSFVSYLYDIYDRNYKVSEPYFGASASQWNEVKYDVYGRNYQSVLFNGRSTSTSYSGLAATFTDGQKSKTITSSVIGNTNSVNETTGGTINYSYFANGNLKQTDYNGVKINIEQDGWGRKTKMIDPSTGVYTYKNNDFGELEVETSKNGEAVTTITRDENGKPIKKTVTGSGTDTETVYEYNSLTKQLSRTTFTDNKQPAGTNRIITSYTYDDVFKRIIKIEEDKTGVTKFTNTFSYDELGRVSTETKEAQLGSKRSTVTTKSEYKNGALYQILDNVTKKVLWQTNALNAKGQITESVLGNGITNVNEYDTNGYISKIKYDKANGQGNVLTLSTQFDFRTDNLDSRTNSAFNNYTEKFKYDEIDRLQEFTNKMGAQETQNYEPSGKIKENSLGVYNYSSQKPYQNTSITLAPQAYEYYANREGNFKEGSQSTTERKLDITYNAFKSPLQITETTIDKISFTYNDNNQRSTMFYGSMGDEALRPLRKHYAADGTMEIKENTTTGAAEFITYIGGDGYTAPVALKSNGVSTADYLYLHRDYQGSILVVTDANANVVEKRLFDAWGDIIKVENGVGTTLSGLTVLDRGYTGHEHLQSVGLINMNARLYDPMLHRFLQTDNYIQDPTNTQNYNQYGYVFNNPLLYIDPSGNASQGGGGDCKGCGIGVGPGDQTGTSFDIDQFIKDYGIDKWWRKNINGDKISKWWKSKVSFNSIFGGKKDSGPPPNLSTYASLNTTGSGQYYGGDGSGSFLDYFSRFVYETDQFNPIALAWDGIMGNAVVTDRYGNELSGFESNMKIVSAIPMTKVASMATNSSIKGISLISSKVLTNGQLIESAAMRAESAIGGTGRFAGSAKHTYAINLLKRYESRFGSRGLQYNYYFNGKSGRGFLDVYDEASGMIYDFKFGKAFMNKAQYQKYSTSFPGSKIYITRP